MLPSGLTELEQLHVEPNSQHSTSLHCSSTHNRCLEMRLGYEQAELSGLVVLEEIHVESNSDRGRHVASSNSLSLASTCQAHAYTHAAHM